MLKLSLILTFLLAVGIYSETNDVFRPKNMENTFSSGKLRLTNDGKVEELVPFKSEHLHAGQPLPSPCTGFRPMTKIAHPTEKTKFIQCRDEFHYDVFSCPNAAEYNRQTGTCDAIIQIKDRCEEEKPCLNDGVCTVVSNSTFKCACRTDWTGDRCETPMNSCVTKPCGPLGECRPLKTSDGEQDYICVCRGRKDYGYNCQDVVPNPCSTADEQFFPFAFSPRAYIQCDGELIYFQSCGSLLYWNQEEKYCDRKRPNNIDSKASSLKVLINSKIEIPKPQVIIDESEELTTPAATPSTVIMEIATEPIRVFQQRPRIESEPTFQFVPTRINNRRPTMPVEPSFTIKNTPEQRFQEGQNNLFATSIEQKPIQVNQWQSYETSTNVPLPTQWRGQNNQRFIETTTFGQNLDRLPVTNEERFRPVPFSRSRIEESLPTTTPSTDNEGIPMRTWQNNPSRADRFRVDNQFWFSTTTTTTAAPFVESDVAQSFMRRENVPSQQQWLNQNTQRLMESTTVGPRFDRLPVTNEERFRSVPSDRFRGETSFSTTTTTVALPIVETNAERLSIRGGSLPSQQQQQWLSQHNRRTFPAQPIQNFQTGINREQEPMRETTTSGFQIKPWPANAFTTPSWAQRQNQPLPMVDPSLFPSQPMQRTEEISMTNMETLSTSTETVPLPRPNQPRLSGFNSFESTTVPNTELPPNFNQWKAVPTMNQRRSQDPTMLVQSGFWKPRS